MLPCERCGRMVAIRSKGLCPACRSKELSPRERGPIAARRPARKDTGLPAFFGRHIEILRSRRVSATGKPIYYPSAANICHLYPKRRYKSVATDDRNVVYLTLEEHNMFDRLLDCMEFDKLLKEFGGVWIKIARTMTDLAPEVEEEGKLKKNLLLWIESKNF